jgi:hypothetical protein
MHASLDCVHTSLHVVLFQVTCGDLSWCTTNVYVCECTHPSPCPCTFDSILVAHNIPVSKFIRRDAVSLHFFKQIQCASPSLYVCMYVCTFVCMHAFVYCECVPCMCVCRRAYTCMCFLCLMYACIGAGIYTHAQ